MGIERVHRMRQALGQECEVSFFFLYKALSLKFIFTTFSASRNIAMLIMELLFNSVRPEHLCPTSNPSEEFFDRRAFSSVRIRVRGDISVMQTFMKVNGHQEWIEAKAFNYRKRLETRKSRSEREQLLTKEAVDGMPLDSSQEAKPTASMPKYFSKNAEKKARALRRLNEAETSGHQDEVASCPPPPEKMNM
jgi:hypothetical protein